MSIIQNLVAMMSPEQREVRDEFLLKVYGAVGDGKTDDTEAVQAMIDDGIDPFPRRMFLISRTLRAKEAKQWDK